MRNIYCLLIFFISCKDVSDDKKYITLHFEYLGGDTCYFLNTDTGKIEVGRTIEFIQNTITDTVVFGYSVIPGQFKGKVMYSKIGDTSGAMHAESFYDADHLPGTDRFWMRPYKGREAGGSFTVKVNL